MFTSKYPHYSFYKALQCGKKGNKFKYKTVDMNIAFTLSHITIKKNIQNACYDFKQRLIAQPTTLAGLSWKSDEASLIFFIASKALPFSSPWHKQKTLATISIIHAGGKQGDLFHNK